MVNLTVLDNNDPGLNEGSGIHLEVLGTPRKTRSQDNRYPNQIRDTSQKRYRLN
jgi:hypothetical protein